MIDTDAPNRLRALLEHDATLLVEAGAGTGKTALLAGRVALLLAAGKEPSQIAAITFTELAASELLGRIGEYIDKLIAGDVPKPLQAALPQGLTRSAARESRGGTEEARRIDLHDDSRLLPAPGHALPGSGRH